MSSRPDTPPPRRPWAPVPRLPTNRAALALFRRARDTCRAERLDEALKPLNGVLRAYDQLHQAAKLLRDLLREARAEADESRRGLEAERALSDSWKHAARGFSERVYELEKGVARHRDYRVYDRCWVDDDELYDLLPGRDRGDRTLPPREEFLARCLRYHQLRSKEPLPAEREMRVFQARNEAEAQDPEERAAAAEVLRVLLEELVHSTSAGRAALLSAHRTATRVPDRPGALLELRVLVEGEGSGPPRWRWPDPTTPSQGEPP